MRFGQITLEREQSARLLGWGIRLFLAAALTASQTPGQYAPFALGCVAAAGPGMDGAAALAGTLVGALLFMRFADALPFLAAGVLILTAATAFQGSRVLSGRRGMSLTAALLSLAVSGIYVAQSLSPLEHFTSCLAAVSLTGASAWFFQPLLQPQEDRPDVNSVLFLSAALLLALQDLEILGLSVGRILLCVLLAYTAYERGAVTGAAAGLGLGLTADLCAGTGSGIFTAGFGLAGLLTGSRMGQRRSSAALAFLAASLAALLPARDPLAQPLLLESVVGAGLFLLLPGRLFGGKRVRRPESGEGVSAMPNRLKEQLTRAAGALREVYECMGRNNAPSSDENPAIVFDRAAEKICRSCALCDLCWQREYTGTFNALNDATPMLLERGRAMAKDFPGYFSDRCIHLPDFITAINGELSAFLLRRQYRRQLEETRRSARGQYAQLSELLTATAAGLGEAVAVSGQAAFACRVGAALRPKEGESVCGDTVVSFQTENGLWCLLLADGMGSGDAARKKSALTCRLLRQFLEAGIEAEAALKTLNAAMALRGAETGSFTTIDLCTCNAATGETAFYKFGAAPSYLKKGGTVRRVTGGSLPAGLRGAPATPDVTRVSLDPGGFAVMISDGVADSGRDEWLLDLLAGWEGEDPQTLAGLILAESIRREHLQDDCGIQVLYRAAEKGESV
ncbi:SpoIIE family protein phosphatase [Oscillibacter sp.]|uniref:SpoIIE family protein phosphatase n=1 Tax=Oscillibacter sp. TaxID=1945593 RepID=UPI00260EF747|nr:SpoIIE family protein phosphatase [Oscillibacter sp.]MDD3346744.1 SpoIIE family protein phosphatase [Oscillibacter sp.]